MPNFERGFKAWAENISLSIRKDLGLKPHDPLPVESLASHLKIELLTPANVSGLSQDHLKQLLKTDTSGWSATTFHIGPRTVIIYNSEHSIKRRASDLMHEFAHILCSHELTQLILSQDGKIEMKSFDKNQEDEAAWLGGCLLLPKQAVLHIKFRGMDDDTASNHYCVSKDMLNYRVGVSGVKNIMSRTNKFSRK